MDHSDTNQHEINMKSAAAVFGGLTAFGVAYNWLVGRVEERGYDEGYTSDLVVGGTLVTVLATWPLLGLRGVAVVLAAFVASGAPMSVGSKLRYRARRERERRYRDGAGKGWRGGGRDSGHGDGEGPVAAAWLQPTQKAGRVAVNGAGRVEGAARRG